LFCHISPHSKGAFGGRSRGGGGVGSACVVKNKGSTFAKLIGGEVRIRERSDALVSRPCLDVDLFFEEEPTPLRFCPMVSKKSSRVFAFSLGSANSEKIQHIVGFACEGLEKELMALFAAIEASHSEKASTLCSSFEKIEN
jgi:hypothetical protein